MPTAENNTNIIRDLENFLQKLKEYGDIKYLIANERATREQKNHALLLRKDLLEDVGRFKPLMVELTGQENITILRQGDKYPTDMWLKGLAIKWDSVSLDVILRCIDVTTLAIGRLKDDIKKNIRDKQGNLVQNQPGFSVQTEYILNNIFFRFHKIVKQLQRRYDSRATLEVNDEYDVQDLMHALLKLHFDDIRPEEWTPSYAGGGSRMDFLLKNEGVVVEVKKTSDNLRDKKIGEQLIVDIARYKAHPDCKNLFCFIYDPEGLVSNPSGLENDLNRLSNNEMKVSIHIAPK